MGITVTHKGYRLIQSDYNKHYMIFEDTTKRFVMHAQYNKELTEGEAREEIERFITYFIGTGEDNG